MEKPAGFKILMTVLGMSRDTSDGKISNSCSRKACQYILPWKVVSTSCRFRACESLFCRCSQFYEFVQIPKSGVFAQPFVYSKTAAK